MTQTGKAVKFKLHTLSQRKGSDLLAQILAAAEKEGPKILTTDIQQSIVL